MVKAILRCFVLAATVILSSCASNLSPDDYPPTPYWMVKETALNNLKPGTTTKQDVLKDVGVPLLKSFFPRQGEEVWDYRYLEGTAIRMIAYVYFDSNGIYKYNARRIDEAYYGVDGIGR